MLHFYGLILAKKFLTLMTVVQRSEHLIRHKSGRGYQIKVMGLLRTGECYVDWLTETWGQKYKSTDQMFFLVFIVLLLFFFLLYCFCVWFVWQCISLLNTNCVSNMLRNKLSYKHLFKITLLQIFCTWFYFVDSAWAFFPVVIITSSFWWTSHFFIQFHFKFQFKRKSETTDLQKKEKRNITVISSLYIQHETVLN